MFAFDASLSWTVGALWYAGVLFGALAVSWLATDLGRIRRTPYIGILAVATGLLSWGFGSHVGAGFEFWSRRWPVGLGGGVAAGVLLFVLARRIPASPHAHGKELGRLAMWECIAYGTAEGVLLSVLPVATVWQAAGASGWSEGVAGSSLTAVAALVASAVVVVVHHLGYWEFRGPLMRFPVVWCTILAMAYLATGSPLAPIVAHILLHAAMVLRGMELPPHPRAAVATAGG